MRFTEEQLDLLETVACCLYSDHEMMEIGEHILKGCNAAIAMMFLEPGLTQLEWKEKHQDFSGFFNEEETIVSKEQLVEAYKLIAAVWGEGNVVTGYAGNHPCFEVDRVPRRFKDDSVIVYWHPVEKGNKNERNLDDYEYYLDMKEFVEAYPVDEKDCAE